jgi:hypothetical protein
MCLKLVLKPVRNRVHFCEICCFHGGEYSSRLLGCGTVRVAQLNTTWCHMPKDTCHPHHSNFVMYLHNNTNSGYFSHSVQCQQWRFLLISPAYICS